MVTTIQSSKFFTIVMTTYNRKNLLSKNIKQLLKSEYSFELLIMDDGPEYNNEEVVKNIKDDRISYYKNIKNEGYAYSLNRGIKLAKHEWIMLCEDDAFIVNPDTFFGLLLKEMKNKLIIGTHIIKEEKPISSRLIYIIKKIFVQTLTHDLIGYNGDKRKHVSYVNNCFAFNKNNISTRFDIPKFKQNTHRIESDFQARSRREGAAILYNPDLKIDHVHIMEGGIPPRTFYKFIYNHIRFLDDYYSKFNIFTYILLLIISKPTSWSVIKKAFRDYLTNYRLEKHA